MPDRNEEVGVATRLIGGSAPPFLIAEVGQAHEGSFERASQFIDAVAGTGFDAIKYQTHIAASESTLDEPFRVPVPGETSRYQYWKRMEFTEREWRDLKEHSQRKGLIFLSSPFSVDAVQLLERLGIEAWKVSSGEAHSADVLEAILATQKPLLVSTGMSTFSEIRDVVARVRRAGVDIALFQCTSMYPTPLRYVGVNVIDELRKRFRCPVGLSDHSGTIWGAIAALGCKADMVEVHVKLAGDEGPDASSSLEPDELKTIADARDAFVEMWAHPIDKDSVSQSLLKEKALFTKSVAVAVPLHAGDYLSEEVLVLKKPGTGISPKEISRLIGRRLTRDVTPDRLLTLADIDD